MLTKGIIISSIQNDKYRYLIRIPSFETSKNSAEDLYWEASVCAPIGLKTAYKSNDIVWVGFEDNKMGNPVIIGGLACEKTDASETKTNVECDSLTVNKIANLPKSLNLGDLNYEDILSLAREVYKISSIIDNNVEFEMTKQLVEGESTTKKSGILIINYFEDKLSFWTIKQNKYTLIGKIS